MASREEEYLRRMKALGYEPSLAGMDEEDFDYVPSWAQNRPRATPLNREYGPVDRDFAERMFRMFANPFDPNRKMPDLDGPEYAIKTRTPGVVDEETWKKRHWPEFIYGENQGQPEASGQQLPVDREKWKRKYLPGWIYGKTPGQPDASYPKPPINIKIGGKDLEFDDKGRPVLRF